VPLLVKEAVLLQRNEKKDLFDRSSVRVRPEIFSREDGGPLQACPLSCSSTSCMYLVSKSKPRVSSLKLYLV